MVVLRCFAGAPLVFLINACIVDKNVVPLQRI